MFPHDMFLDWDVPIDKVSAVISILIIFNLIKLFQESLFIFLELWLVSL
jgi:hypothetical protein